MPIAEFLQLLEVKLFGHFPQRVVSRLRVTDATQEVSQPLSRIRHLNPRAPCYSVARIARRNDVDHCARLGNQAQVAGVERAYYVSVRLPPSLAASGSGITWSWVPIRSARRGSSSTEAARYFRVTQRSGKPSLPSIAAVLAVGNRFLPGIGRMLEWVILGAIVLLTAVSRVYVRAHWPIDVLASTLVA